MEGEKDLSKLIKSLKPIHNPGEYVFCSVKDLNGLKLEDIVLFFKEAEGVTVILERAVADKLGLPYSFVASWITLAVHSALDAVGLTASFSKALADEGISCNVVAAYYHDHIFVDKTNVAKALQALSKLSAS